MATHGFLGEFDSANKTWQAYNTEWYFVTNNITGADKKRAILVSVCGPATYQLICNLFTPDKPTDKLLDDIIMQKDHFQPAVSSVTVR